MGDKAAIVKHGPAVHTQRHIFVSGGFITKHDELCRILREACLLPTSKWIMYQEAGECTTFFNRAVRTRPNACYVALLVKGESKAALGFHRNLHTFTAKGFLVWLTRLDQSKTCTGAQ